MINFSVSVECSDLDANFQDYHWVAKSKIMINENTILEDGLIGYGGSNNKQYDHRTWDTVFNSFVVSVRPGETLLSTISIEEINGGSNMYITKIVEKIIGYIIDIHDNV